MKLRNKIAAVATALALGLGGAVAVAAPASAHTGGVTGVASCEADGTYTIEWTYNAKYVPAGVEAETKAMTTSQGSLAPIDGVNKGGQIFLSVWSDHQVNVPGAPVKTGNWSAKFKTVGIPGSFVGDVTTMVQTDWKNGPSEDPVGKVKVDGTCKPPVVVPPKPADTVVSVPTESVNCESKVVTISTVTTTTGTRLENNVWVPTEPVVSAPVITTRPATEQECPTTPPEQPEETVTVTETTDKDCDAKTVTTTTTTTTSGRTVYNEETNTWDPIEDLVVVTSSERPTTAEECPAVVVPPTTNPSPIPSTTSTPAPAANGDSELAETGQDMNLAPVFWSVLGVIVLGAAFLIGSFFWRRRHPVTTTEE